jgi:hypothetical protein
VRVARSQLPNWASQSGVTSVAIVTGRGAPAGFHHVSSVELPPKRSVGGPCPPAPRVRTRRAKISLTLPPEPM